MRRRRRQYTAEGPPYIHGPRNSHTYWYSYGLVSCNRAQNRHSFQTPKSSKQTQPSKRASKPISSERRVPNLPKPETCAVTGMGAPEWGRGEECGGEGAGCGKECGCRGGATAYPRPVSWYLYLTIRRRDTIPVVFAYFRTHFLRNFHGARRIFWDWPGRRAKKILQRGSTVLTADGKHG